MTDPLEKAVTAMGRQQIDQEEWNTVIKGMTDLLNCRIKQKGSGVFVSPHELSGVITEEYNEVLDQIHMAQHMPSLYKELLDLAVACIWGAVSIRNMPDGSGICRCIYKSAEPKYFVGARKCQFCGMLIDVSDEIDVSNEDG